MANARPSRRQTVVDPAFLADLNHWQSAQPRVATRIVDLALAIERDPFTGPGQPERLRHRGANVWSRRIDQHNRLVYTVTDTQVVLQSARGHYD